MITSVIDTERFDFSIEITERFDFSIEIVEPESELANWIFNNGVFDRSGTFFRNKTFLRS
jgi:hypothetical protein